MFCLVGKILVCTKSITHIIGIKSHMTTIFLQEMETLVPMLKKMGYDPLANPPDYSKTS